MHHFEVVPRLSDGVVVLDAHGPADLDSHVAGEDDETALRFGWWPNRSDLETAAHAFQDWSDQWVSHGSQRTFAVRDTDGQLVGGCELRLQPDGVTGHVSYWTNADERGRGYASRALLLLADYAEAIGITRLKAHVAPDNLASRRVSERAGFLNAGTFTEEDGAVTTRYCRSIGT